MGGQTTTDARTGEQPTQLKRAIGPVLLFLFILGDMLGGEIYALVGEVGAEVGGAVALGGGEAEFARNLEFRSDAVPFMAVLGGASLAFYALIGFEDSVNVAEEVRQPTPAYPIALFGGLAAAAVIYMLVTVTASAVVPTDQLAESSGPLLEVVRQGPLGVSPALFSFIALFAVFNGALINMIMASRLLYGMSQERILPGAFGRVLPQRRTPWVAIVFTTLVAAALLLTGDLGTLADTTVVLLLAVFAVVNVAVLVLRRDVVDHDHFRAPTVIPVLGAVVSLVLITQNEAGIYLRAGILLTLGVVLWFVNRAVSGRTDDVDPSALTG